MNPVIVRLVGGLGNQMFQYAAARAVAIRSNARLQLDLSWFGTDPDRKYALAPLKIDAEIAVPQPAQAPRNGFLARIRRRLQHDLGLRQPKVPLYAEKSFRYDSAIELVCAPVSMDGYFQSERYFHSVRGQIAQDFALRAPPALQTQAMLDEIANSDAICLHIRRGDYVNNAAANAYHGTCSLDYYREGLKIVTEGLERPHCFVFSDDPAWVRENFQADLPMTLVDIHGTDEAHEDLRLMSACKRYVIANSSLSWWGAWLGSRSGKLVVAPKRWFQKNDNDTSDLLPAEWLRV